jgi:hypothetical protein
VYQYTIGGLAPGVPYSVQVSSLNAAGTSAAQTAVPGSLAPPRQKPSEPQDVYVVTHSAQSLKVLFMAPASDGGDMVSSYKIEWDTSAAFNSLGGSALGSYHSLVNPINDCSQMHCPYVISDLVKGVPHFVRVFSLNSYGYSATAGIPATLFETPKTQPSAPTRINASPAGPDAIQLTILPTADDGGSAVTRYRVEWDVVGPEAFDSVLTSPANSLLYYPYSVQRIRSASAAYDLSGSFVIGFAGFATAPIPVDASADVVERALEATPLAGNVRVDKALDAANHGTVWTVTFLNSGEHTYLDLQTAL